MSEIVWEDPPHQMGRRGIWGQRLQPFRDRPGEWGRLPGRFSVSVSSHIKRGIYADVERGDFEARCQNVADGTCDIYVRYVGGGKTKATA